MTFVLASVGTDQPLPTSLVAPLAAAGAVLALLLVLGWLATRSGGASAISRRALPVGVVLFALWVGGTLAVALHLRSGEQVLHAREAALVDLAARSVASLDGLTAPVSDCAGKLEVVGLASLVGYLVVPPRVVALREKLPRPDFYPRLLVPAGQGMVTLDSIGVPLRPPPPLSEHLRRAAAAAPWDWPSLWSARPLNDLSDVRALVIASLRTFDAQAGRLELAVRVLPAAGGDPLCEGTSALLLPPGSGTLVPLATSLEAAAFTDVCRAGGDAFCGHVRRFAPPSPAPR